MEKKTLYALFALVVLGAGGILVTRSPEKGQRIGPPPRPIPALKAAEISKLELATDKQERISLEKTADGWHEKAPVDWPADPSAAKSLTEALEKLAFHDEVTETAAKHAELGVEENKASRVTVKGAGDKIIADLLIGKALGGFTMVRVAGKNEVWQATHLQPYLINRDAKGWRDHTIFDFKADQADKITIASPGSKLVLESVPPE